MDEVSVDPIGPDLENARDLDVVFVHGLGGDPIETWSHDGSTTNSFPYWLARDFGGARFWTLAYPAEKTKWTSSNSELALPDVSNNALQMLWAESIGTRRLIFVCHSLGGLLVKQMLRAAESMQNPLGNKLLENLRTVIFVATPHRGSGLSNVAKLIPLLRPTVIAAGLDKDNPHLLDLAKWYSERSLILKIETIACIERLKTNSFLVVDRASADPQTPDCRVILLQQDHTSICKPDSRKRPIYKYVKGAVSRSLPDRRPSTVAAGGLRPMVVSLAIVTRQNEVLMVLNRNDPDDLTWQFPAKLVKFGSDPRLLAPSAALEETGVHCQVAAKIDERVHPRTHTICHYFHCHYLQGEADNIDTEENVAVAWIPIKDLDKYITSDLSTKVKSFLTDFIL